MATVKTVDLVKIYKMGKSEVHALRGMNLEVEKGEFLVIMGRSGSGKSTLLNLIGCLDRPTSGSVYLDGVEVSALPKRKLPRIRREKIGFVFQNFNLIPTLTALENVMLPLRYAGMTGKEQRKRAIELLERVGLGDRLHHRPMELSGGEQQRVAIARALVNDPSLVLADEPTGEVDTETCEQIIGLMRELNRTLDKTFIIVTHDPLVAQKADRVVYLKDGQIEREEVK